MASLNRGGDVEKPRFSEEKVALMFQKTDRTSVATVCPSVSGATA